MVNNRAQLKLYSKQFLDLGSQVRKFRIKYVACKVLASRVRALRLRKTQGGPEGLKPKAIPPTIPANTAAKQGMCDVPPHSRGVYVRHHK